MGMREGQIHRAMRRILRHKGWQLIAGEYPGGTDHELAPLNVTDPRVARDFSPAPRQHSLGELIPDLVALSGRLLLIGEAKPRYDASDEQKLRYLIEDRRVHLTAALAAFAKDRQCPELLPIESLEFVPCLIFPESCVAPRRDWAALNYLRIRNLNDGFFEGTLAERT